MNNAAAPMQTNETYGIHILKVAVIMLQVIAHSYLWSVQKGLMETADIGNLWNNITYTALSLALILPMTAGAVLRMVSQVDIAQDRIININWRHIWAGSALLALLESAKQALVYESGVFFSWNVLHVIAITCPLIMLIGRYSIALLWSIALTIIFITPLMIEWLEPLEFVQWLPGPLPFPALGGLLALALSLFLWGIVRRVLRSPTMAVRYKARVLALLAVGWAAGCYALLGIPNSGTTGPILNALPMGALVGTLSGMHIWAFFPWAGTIMLGFLIYDAIIRMRASPHGLRMVIGFGLVLLFIFYASFVNDVTSTLTAKAVFGGYHFNRLPSKMLMVVGLFCMAVPLCIWLARRGAETPYVVLLSRYVLWLYIYQTTLQMVIPPWVQHTFGGADGALTNGECIVAATVLSVIGALLLPLVIKRIPLSLNLKLARSR